LNITASRGFDIIALVIGIYFKLISIYARINLLCPLAKKSLSCRSDLDILYAPSDFLSILSYVPRALR
jgi:hypothetical protein